MAKNPIARALRSPHLKMQLLKNKKTYSRKQKHKMQSEIKIYQKGQNLKNLPLFLYAN